MSTPVDPTPDRRASLADKGRKLYGKFCGTGGRGICAESFAVYHIGRGEPDVAEDLVAHLERVAAELEATDPDGRLAATRGLAARIRAHIASAPTTDLPQAGPALRRFVLDNADGAEPTGTQVRHRTRIGWEASAADDPAQQAGATQQQ